ncbi:MAG: hypothetical protein ACO276_00575 [Ilumatobacteraceae bacterium]
MSIAQELGVDAEVVLYIKTPPDAATLRSIIAKLEDPVTDLVRRDSLWKKLGLTDADVATADQVVAVLENEFAAVSASAIVKLMIFSVMAAVVSAK